MNNTQNILLNLWKDARYQALVAEAVAKIDRPDPYHATNYPQELADYNLRKAEVRNAALNQTNEEYKELTNV